MNTQQEADRELVVLEAWRVRLCARGLRDAYDRMRRAMLGGKLELAQALQIAGAMDAAMDMLRTTTKRLAPGSELRAAAEDVLSAFVEWRVASPRTDASRRASARFGARVLALEEVAVKASHADAEAAAVASAALSSADDALSQAGAPAPGPGQAAPDPRSPAPVEAGPGLKSSAPESSAPATPAGGAKPPPLPSTRKAAPAGSATASGKPVASGAQTGNGKAAGTNPASGPLPAAANGPATTKVGGVGGRAATASASVAPGTSSSRGSTRTETGSDAWGDREPTSSTPVITVEETTIEDLEAILAEEARLDAAARAAAATPEASRAPRECTSTGSGSQRRRGRATSRDRA